MNNLKNFKYWKEAANDYWVEKLGMGKGEDW